jgi:hypothetical protein
LQEYFREEEEEEESEERRLRVRKRGTVEFVGFKRRCGG